jgi:hypothetical protein
MSYSQPVLKVFVVFPDTAGTKKKEILDSRLLTKKIIKGESKVWTRADSVGTQHQLAGRALVPTGTLLSVFVLCWPL